MSDDKKTTVEKKRHPVRNFLLSALFLGGAGAAGTSYAYETGKAAEFKANASSLIHTVTFGNFGSPKPKDDAAPAPRQ